MAWTWRDIPLQDGNEVVSLLHPVVAARVAALCWDPRIRGNRPGEFDLAIDSGVRSQTEQRTLWNCYRARLVTGRCPCASCNTAADPDAKLGGAYGLPYREGSWHMAQDDGRGYAVDLGMSRFCARRGISRPAGVAIVHPIAAEYRLAFTVPGEDWHVQPPLVENPLRWVPPDPREEDLDMTADELSAMLDAKLAPIKADAAAARAEIHDLREQVSLGTKPPNRTMQKALGDVSDKVDVIFEKVT